MKSLSFVPVAMLALASTLVGCGTDATNPTGNSLTTDTTAPGAPASVSASYDVASGVDVLTWSPNPEADVNGYEIYRYSPNPARMNSYILVGTVAADHPSFQLQRSAGGTEYYRVRATDVDGNRSAESAVCGFGRTPNTFPEPVPTEPGGGRDFE